MRPVGVLRFANKLDPVPGCASNHRAFNSDNAGIDPEFDFHGLRHIWASWHVMGGMPLPVLQPLGAWASLDMVMRYAHLAPATLPVCRTVP